MRVERATVLWVNGCEFAIEVDQRELADQAWVNQFLQQKLGLPWMSDTPTAAVLPSWHGCESLPHIDHCPGPYEGG